LAESLRIAITNPDLVWVRGAQRQVIMLAREWRSLGHEVLIVAGEKASPYAFDHLLEGIDVRTTGAWQRDLGLVNKLPGSGALRAIMAKRGVRKASHVLDGWRPDVVNAHNHPAQWTAGLLPDVAHVWTCNEPPLWHYYPDANHRLRDPWMRSTDAKLTRTVRAITVLDSRIAGLVKRGYPGIPVHTTGSGCELPGPLPRRGVASDITRPGFHVVSVLGVLHQQKRPHDTVKAAVLSRIPRTTLHLVGADPGGIVDELRAEARSGGITLVHHASLSEERLLGLYANADAALFVPENQPWGIFPLEALLAGVPAVLSRETGSLEALPQDYPFVTDVGDAATAAAHLRRIASDPEGAQAATKASAEAIRRDHSWSACARRVLDVLRVAM